MQAAWTDLNAEWISPSGNFIPSQLYNKAQNATGLENWESDDPDSLYEDLHTVELLGKFDIEWACADEVFGFHNILLTEYDGGVSSIENSINKALSWINGKPIFKFPHPGCCDVPGDANNNNSVNLLDITFLIAYLYKDGPAPDCNDEADANGNGAINILDITYLINYLYKGGPEPICGTTGWKGCK